MKIEQQAKFRCDGCGVEKIDPMGWVHLQSIYRGGYVTFAIGTPTPSTDYCSDCFSIMKNSISNRMKNSITKHRAESEKA
jgi:hypothetical protein